MKLLTESRTGQCRLLNKWSLECRSIHEYFPSWFENPSIDAIDIAFFLRSPQPQNFLAIYTLNLGELRSRKYNNQINERKYGRLYIMTESSIFE